VSTLRERIEQAKKYVGQRGSVGKLFRRLHDAGPRLSREEFTAAAAWQPLLSMEFLRWMMDTARDLKETRTILLQQLRRTDKLDKKFDEVLHGYWCSVWFVGHSAVLAAMDGRQGFDDLPEKAAEALTQLPFAWVSVRQGVLGVAMRGIWGTARIGKMLLPTYKRLHGQATTYLRVTEAVFSLAALGLRHSRLAAEVKKTLASPLPPTPGDEPYQKLLKVIADTALTMLDCGRQAREVMLDVHREFGRKLAVMNAENARPGSKHAYKRPDDVPNEIAAPLTVNTSLDFVGDKHSILFMAYILPWLAQAEAEDLYMPAEYLTDVKEPFTPADTTKLLLTMRDTSNASPGTYVAPPEGPARKGPCPCGSGKKYKRCCAEKEASGQGDVEA